jgi:hypothetical protein
VDIEGVGGVTLGANGSEPDPLSADFPSSEGGAEDLPAGRSLAELEAIRARWEAEGEPAASGPRDGDRDGIDPDELAHLEALAPTQLARVDEGVTAP